MLAKTFLSSPDFNAKRLPRGRLLALAVITALTGCSTLGPSFQAPTVQAPPQWSEPSDAAVSALPTNRWAAFDDATLTHLQSLAMQANQDVRIAALRLMQSRVGETTVAAQRGPNVNAKGGATRQRQSESGAGTRLVGAIAGNNQQPLIDMLSSPFTQYQAGFDASWEPDLWGRVTRAEEAARADTDGRKALLGQVQLGVVAEVARAYFQLRALQAQTQWVEQELVLARDSEKVLLALYQGGLSDESSLTQQRAQVAALEGSLPTLRAGATQAKNQISLLCGRHPGALQAELDAPKAVAAAAKLPDLSLGLPSELARNRPDVAAAEARLHAATANIGLAMADLYPRVVLGASFGLESISADKFGEWGSRQWAVGPSLSIPLFDRGRRHSIVTLRELQQQEAAVSYQQTVLKAWHDVENALSAYRAEAERGVKLQARVSLAQEQATLARARYAQGMTNYLPLSGAELGWLEANRELADSHGRQQTMLAALYKALGDDGILVGAN